jgi:hypothetical protein
MAVFKPPVAVASPDPKTMARSPMFVVVHLLAPVVFPKPLNEMHDALAVPAEPSDPMAGATVATAPSNTPPARRAGLWRVGAVLLFPMWCLCLPFPGLVEISETIAESNARRMQPAK